MKATSCYVSGHCLRTSAVLKRVGEVIGDDLSSADAVIVGSPVYVGNMSGLGTGTGKMRYKVGAAFATGASGSNGKEITMLTILGAMLGSQMIVISGGGGGFGASATTGADSPGARTWASVLRKLPLLFKRGATK
jgi:NAD(P)H dehydrogenase (quinone)